MKKSTAILLAVLLVTLMAAGCSSRSKFEPEESSIYIQRDGGVTGFTKTEGYDKDYYSLKELKEDYVDPAVKAYNEEKAGLSFAYTEDNDTKETLQISIEELDIAGGVAKMKLEYATAADYLAFNKNQLEDDTVFQIGLMADLSVPSSISWVDAEGNSVDAETVQGSTKYYVAELSFATIAQVEGTIVYASEGVTVTGKNTIVTDGTETAYVVFKK